MKSPFNNLSLSFHSPDEAILLHQGPLDLVPKGIMCTPPYIRKKSMAPDFLLEGSYGISLEPLLIKPRPFDPDQMVTTCPFSFPLCFWASLVGPRVLLLTHTSWFHPLWFLFFWALSPFRFFLFSFHHLIDSSPLPFICVFCFYWLLVELIIVY